MKPLVRFFLMNLILLVIPLWVSAQDLVSFEAKANAKQVVLGDHFQVYFIIGNASAKNFQAPSFKNFDRLSGRNQSTSTSITNGKMEMQTTYSYFLKPKKLGKLEIGKASIEIDGKKYFTKPITVEVVKGKTQKDGTLPEEKIFIRAEVNTSEAVPGQPIILDYKVYTTIPVQHYSIVEDPSYNGFFTTFIRRFNAITTKEIINGVSYSSKILRRMALYPQQTGKQTISPMRFRISTPTNNKTKPSSPFSFIQPTETVFIESNALEINVKPLPKPIPASFSGAVGKYAASAAIDKEAATTDDAITLQIRVDGDGDIKRVTAPKLILSDTFEVYDPNVVNENQSEKNGTLIGTKTFEYLILPKQAGTYTLQPEFSYFDTDSFQFVTLKPNTFTVNIMKGQYNTNVNKKPKETPKEKAEIQGIQTSWAMTKKNHFVGSGLFWGLVIVPILVFIGGFFYKKYLDNKPEIDVVAQKRSKAQKVAKQRLSAAEKFLKQGEHRSFYDETSKCLLGYASDKFNISGSELKKSNVEQHLRSSGAKTEHISRFMSLLQTCEKAIYAPSSLGDANAVYKEAVDVIVEIER